MILHSTSRLGGKARGGFSGIPRNTARGSRRVIPTGKTDRAHHHAMYDDSAPRVHRDRGSLPERLPAL